MHGLASLAFALPAFLTQGPAAGSVTLGGQVFPSWQAYVESPLFRAQGRRCGTRAQSDLALRPPSDCSLASTIVRPEYAPAGHPLYRIPVVVHVLRATNGDGELTDATIQSQIDVLNEDFRARAGTLGQNGFDARVEFALARTDPNGQPTSGITRTTNNNWFNDLGNYYDTLAWDPARYLNIYTNTASGYLGYVPDLPAGGIVGTNQDRVVVLWAAFGRNAPVGPPYDLGRTATHEIGHYLGLYHTFDFGCDSGDCYLSGDRICDTNPEANPVFGCPSASLSCGGADPIHNYMDYTDDACYEEFTPEQVNRMRCTLVNWRTELDETCTNFAAVTTRTGGHNQNVFSATPPVLGSSFTLDIVAPGRTSAVVFGFARAGSKLLPNGMLQLVDELSPRYFLLTMALPVGSAVLHMPSVPALCGVTAFTQAAVLGGGPWALTNSVDLTPGL